MNWTPITWTTPKDITFPEGIYSPCAGVPAPVHASGPTYRFYFRFPYDWDVFNLPPGSKVAGGLEVGLSNRNEDGFYVDFYYKSASILTDHIMSKFNFIHILKFDFCVENKTIQALLKRLNLPNLEYFDFNRSSRNSGWELQLHEATEFRQFFLRHPKLHTLLLRSTWGDNAMAELFSPKDGFIMPCMEVLDLQRDPRPNVAPFTLQANEAKQFCVNLKDSCPLLRKLSLKGLMEDNALANTVRVVMMPYLVRYDVTRERDPINDAEARRLAEVAKLHVPVKLFVNATWESASSKRAFEAAMATWAHNYETSPAPPPPPPPVYTPPPPPPPPPDDEDEPSQSPAPSTSPAPTPSPSPSVTGTKGKAPSATPPVSRVTPTPRGSPPPPRASPPPPGLRHGMNASLAF